MQTSFSVLKVVFSVFVGYDKISSANSFNAFSRKCPKTTNLTCFTKSKYRQIEENQQTMTKM